ncbi:hypothetical protein BVRB_5g116070 [Beta vulgaris subsp. vulgaris]|nr:hypothetical protein BVRB_5g116070 [Beta vulgaris subsp. vulgaris]
MEEDKAAAYYDELTRKGSGAARFKQGLGFSSAETSDEPPLKGSALPSSSSFLSNFVKASGPTKEIVEDKKTQIENIQNKLKKRGPTSSIDTPSEETRVRDRRRSRSRERDRDRGKEKDRRKEKDLRRERSRSRSRSREGRRRKSGGGSDEERERLRRRYRSSSREGRKERGGERRRRRSRSRSYSDGERRRGRDKGRSRSVSPRDRRRSERGREGGGGKERRVMKKEGNGAADYAKLIDGYDKMTPAERVKAKMKLQLSQTAEKDTKMGTGSQWERFDFNKDAPLDDKEVEAADDDAALLKHIGKTFRFTSLETKREDEVKNAHDEAMFGVPAPQPDPSSASESEEERGNENENKETNDDDRASSFMNEKILLKQQGSWRDRARRNVG